MNHNEQRDTEQALLVAEKLNDALVAQELKVPARIQFIAHLICALGLAQANNVSIANVITTLRKIHKEMIRTAREATKRKPQLAVVASSIKSAIDDDQGNNP